MLDVNHRNTTPLDVARLVDGARLLLLGGTGFLGKVFWGMLLDRYPGVGKIFLLVRGSRGKTSSQRFWEDVATSESLRPLREKYGEGFEAFLREKIVPIDGDMGKPLCGVDQALVRELKGTIDAVVNVAGVVDFNPPLDESLDANAFGSQNLVNLARALGDTPVMHTSTCYVAGRRRGPILETDPGEYPFPRCDELGRDLWDPDREIAECLELIAEANHRANDAFRQSEFAEQAKKNLLRRGEPTQGPAFDSELAKVKRKFVSDRLIAAGKDRASHWGWPNIYTYTKSIGEQVIARSGLPFTLVRPACCETTLKYPFPSWNEGISTSAPLIFLIMKGQTQLPAAHVPLDFIPTDWVCAGMILSLAELLEGTAKPVYQYGTSDVNPATAARLGELVALYKRKHFARKGTGNPFLNILQTHFEPVPCSAERLEKFGPKAIARAGHGVAGLLKKVPALKPAANALEQLATQEEKIGYILELFTPFTTEQNGPFSCANTRAAYARLSAEDKAKLEWAPETLDWPDWVHNVHMPGVQKWILPEMEKKYRREVKPLRPHETLVTLLEQMAERHDRAVALQRLEADGFSRITYRDVLARARAASARLASAGIRKSDRVAITAQNHPDWAIAFFGIQCAGATAVPIDPGLAAPELANVLAESGAKVALWDPHVEEKSGAEIRARLPSLTVIDLARAAAEAGSEPLVPPVVEVEESDIASLIFTSGTTGTPKGVKLTHANFTSLIAALAPVFPLTTGDRVLSVLPLHHTFEFTCGLLLPFSRGARVAYLDELSGDRLTAGLQLGKITAMVGVPALWQLLERRILAQVAAKGPVAETLFELGAELNRKLGKTVGVDAGRVLFGPVHEALGGKVKYLISGGAALPKETHELFLGLGLRLTEGYGLTEAAPVLTVSKPSAKSKPGNVGRPIPGVTLTIANPDENGVGEVLAKGPNVMAGYTDPEATAEVIDAQGWLHTGDLGRLDRQGRLEIVGRAKDVVVTATGENVYPDDVERRIGKIPYVSELAIVGIDDPAGGERIGCLAVPEENGVERSVRNERALRGLREAFANLPFGMRPAVVHLYEAPLPRNASRKVLRKDVRHILARMVAATAKPLEGDEAVSAVRLAIAAVRGRTAREVTAMASLRGDLGFDSLTLTELLVALEAKYGDLDPAALQACETVADVERLVGDTSRSIVTAAKGVEEKKGPIVLPPPVQDAAKTIIGKFQDAFYGRVMRPEVYGRAFIPHNRNTLVVANHASHLDMGFVRHALGTYGEDLVTLAAQDYFFDGNDLRRAFFENMTNLRSIDRKGGLRASERQSAEVIAQGKTLLIFPEGTRSPDGIVQEFKPLIGHLALTYGVDILPIHLGGTHAAMPKGAALPTRREITAHIGPPLTVQDLRRLTKGMSRADATREVARLAREAVLALRDGRVLDLSKVGQEAPVVTEAQHPLVGVFQELETKFKPGKTNRPISFYFTLGGDAMAKWTVRIDAARCEIKPGKPEGGTADCVLKTSPEIFTKIVREAYTPGPAEFLSGAIKSNDVELLMTFQKVFELE